MSNTEVQETPVFNRPTLRSVLYMEGRPSDRYDVETVWASWVRPGEGHKAPEDFIESVSYKIVLSLCEKIGLAGR